jgi:hypothetical protein
MLIGANMFSSARGSNAITQFGLLCCFLCCEQLRVTFGCSTRSTRVSSLIPPIDKVQIEHIGVISHGARRFSTLCRHNILHRLRIECK